jgi:hypothetical protein
MSSGESSVRILSSILCRRCAVSFAEVVCEAFARGPVSSDCAFACCPRRRGGNDSNVIKTPATTDFMPDNVRLPGCLSIVTELFRHSTAALLPELKATRQERGFTEWPGLRDDFRTFALLGAGQTVPEIPGNLLSRNSLGAAIGYGAADVGEFSEGSLWAQ